MEFIRRYDRTFKDVRIGEVVFLNDHLLLIVGKNIVAENVILNCLSAQDARCWNIYGRPGERINRYYGMSLCIKT